MLIHFKWLCKLITLLLASGRLEIDDLDSVMVSANHYYSNNFAPQQAFELIHMAWPDIRFHNDGVEEPADTPEDEKESPEEPNPKPHEWDNK